MDLLKKFTGLSAAEFERLNSHERKDVVIKLYQIDAALNALIDECVELDYQLEY